MEESKKLVKEIIDFIIWASKENEIIELMKEEISFAESNDEESAILVKEHLNSFAYSYLKENEMHHNKEHFLIYGL